MNIPNIFFNLTLNLCKEAYRNNDYLATKKAIAIAETFFQSGSLFAALQTDKLDPISFIEQFSIPSDVANPAHDLSTRGLFYHFAAHAWLTEARFIQRNNFSSVS